MSKVDAIGAGLKPVRRSVRAIAFALFGAGLVLAMLFAAKDRIASFTYGALDLRAASEGSSVVLDRNGRLLRPFTTADGRWKLPVRAADIDPVYLELLKTYEDKRFGQHGGVDFLAMARALGQSIRYHRVVSGGSTLTMQVARLLEPRDERNVGAKLRQVARAWQLESSHSKNDVLDFYLTLAPYGGNIEGVRAASLAYFGKEPRRLSLAEAALLVALPQSPETRRPDRFPIAAKHARDRVIQLAEQRGIISGADAVHARLESVPEKRKTFPMLAPHAAEVALRARPDTRVHHLAIDHRLQVTLEALARDRIDALGPKSAIALLVVENATGAVRAHVGGAEYFNTQRAGSIDLTQAVRSPGSALKPFIYAFAFENGIAHPETMLDDRPSRFSSYSPENFDLSFQGMVTARKALQQSLNVPAVELLVDVGPARFIARLRSAGADIVLPRDASPGLAAALGGLGIRLSDMAKLYAALARGGTSLPLLAREGDAPLPDQERRLSDTVSAWYISDVLRGTPPPLNALGGRIAFKTGTSYGYRDAWAAGFDKHHTIVVWAGRPDGAPIPGLTGRTVAAPILFDAFARLGGDFEAMPRPPDALVATTATLPPPLRHVRKDMAKTAVASTTAVLKIAYPPDGARVDLGFSRGQGSERNELALKAHGGKLPLIWLVNGNPVTDAELRRQAHWSPDGAGFARVSVMDASGAADSVVIRIE